MSGAGTGCPEIFFWKNFLKIIPALPDFFFQIFCDFFKKKFPDPPEKNFWEKKIPDYLCTESLLYILPFSDGISTGNAARPPLR